MQTSSRCLQRGINLRALAEKMGQCSGAEVRGICTEAGMYALRERRQHVTQDLRCVVLFCRLPPLFLLLLVLSFLVLITLLYLQVLKKNQEGNTSVNKLFS